MAPRAMKRPAAASAGAPAKKPAAAAASKKKDPIMEKCQLVSAAIAEAELSEKVKGMLMSLVEGSLGVFAEERIPYQSTFVEMIGETVTGVGQTLEKAVADATEKVGSFDAEKTSREAKVGEAEAAVTSTKATAEEMQEAFAGDKAALEEATKALKAAEAAQKNGDAELKGAAGKKEALEAANGGMFTPMKETRPNAAEVNRLLALAKKHGCEEMLLDSLPLALKKAPEERGTFDAMVIGQFEEWFTSSIAGAVKILADGEAGRTERASAVETAAAAKNLASDKLSASKTSLDEAKTAKSEAEAALRAAKDAVESFESDREEASAALEVAKAKLASFTEGPLAAFNELKELRPPPPEPEVAPETEAGEATQPDTAPAESAATETAPEVPEA